MKIGAHVSTAGGTGNAAARGPDRRNIDILKKIRQQVGLSS